MFANADTAMFADLDRKAAAIWRKRRARNRQLTIHSARVAKSARQFAAIAFA